MLRDLRVGVQEPVEVVEFLTCYVRVGVTGAVFAIFKPSLPLHEEARGFLNLLTHSRMAGQEGAQVRVVFHPLRVVRSEERRVGKEGGLRRSVEDAGESGEVLTGRVRVGVSVVVGEW